MTPQLTQRARWVTRTLVPARSTIPGPRAQYPGQFFIRMASDKLALFADMARHGDVSRIQVGPQAVVLLMHPDDIRRVLVTNQRTFVKGRATRRTKLMLGDGLLTSEGELHLRQRRLMQPAFHRERLADYGRVMATYAGRAADSWRSYDLLDAHEAMMRLTLAIAGRTLFDADVERDAREIGEALGLALRMFNYMIFPVGPILQRMPLRWVRDYHKGLTWLDGLIYRMIAERRAAGEVDRGDLLSMLLAARDAEGDGTGMDDRQLRDEIVTLLMAGHETTANWLAWTWYLLSQNPEAEARLHDELHRVLGGRAPAVEDIPRLEYTRRVLAEALRVYPPAWAVEREALVDFEVRGHRIEKGDIIVMSQWLVHRDPRWWVAPERFDPDRWAPDLDATRPKFSFFPFGAGTRICIGENFAWMEAALVLATMAQRWRLRYETAQPPIPEPLVTLRPKGGLMMRVLER
jgi:cytochrome P450